ncbi:MAG: hypothetical protein B6I37_07385 [Desulfobacteraceae bacterium 4572_35.2]|nr:MAG: hypothetical protein B6I37_07385 [Desulfobacteraceae bacterium 4572_35.2]
MEQEQQKYIDCAACGVSILEQCAIEDGGKLLCGDCIVKTTKKEVVKAEKISKEKREKEYEIERKKIIAKKKKNGVLILIVAIIIFIFTQWLMSVNQPEPIQSITVDYSKDLYAAKALITIGIYKYTAEMERLPLTLNDLSPQYVRNDLDKVFKTFSYVRLDNGSYELEIIAPTSLTQGGANDEE